MSFQVRTKWLLGRQSERVTKKNDDDQFPKVAVRASTRLMRQRNESHFLYRYQVGTRHSRADQGSGAVTVAFDAHGIRYLYQ